ncbi:MAG: hypothetical protein HZA93_29615 [Verrucomicrobia bacterium]|nr:hypothetical protein [Verrucomicrobiota bacterium]
MSTVQEIESAIKRLSHAEMSQIRDWLEDFLEDQKEFTPEFRARVETADRELASGARPRVRQP